MKRSGWILGVSLVGLGVVIAAPASHASHDVNFGVNTPLGNDGSLFFSISSQYFDRDARMVNTWGRRFTNPDDLAVFLQICAHSNRPPEVVYSYRRQGMTWYDVGIRSGVPLESWYVVVQGTPQGRYARPYDHWNRYQQDPRHAVKFTDREARDLVAVRMAHEYYGVTPAVAMNWRKGGASMKTIMTREYRVRHGEDRRGDHDQRGRDHHQK
jgi:hypothetical protein